MTFLTDLFTSYFNLLYFTKTIATMQKSNGKSVAFFGNKRLLSQTHYFFESSYRVNISVLFFV
nr:hypothetical protein [Streptococcus pneumoniae]